MDSSRHKQLLQQTAPGLRVEVFIDSREGLLRIVVDTMSLRAVRE